MGKRCANPNNVPPKVPKRVQMARERLDGTDVTGESLKDSLSKTDFDRLTSAFRSVLTPEQKDVYKSFGADAARRDYMASWVLSPAEFKGSAVNNMTTVNDTLNLGTGKWVTEAQLGEPKRLNDTKAAKGVVRKL